MNIAIILAGGTGSRVGREVPKQFIELAGEMMLIRSMKPLADSPYINNMIIVADGKWHEKIEDAIADEPQVSEKMLGFAMPGENRQLSIYNGLKKIEEMGLSDMTDYVVVHDGARPFVTEKTIEDSFAQFTMHEGAMPVLPMSDTVYFSHTGTKVDKLLDRSSIFAGQAPETFDYKKYLKANEALMPDKILLIKGSTEPAIMAGMDIAMFPGDQRNFKITTGMDLERAEEILKGECL